MNRTFKVLRLISILILISSIAAPGIAIAHGSAAPARLHPFLAHLAAQQPGQVVEVIVQKANGSDRVEQAVTRSGGQVTKDLSMINAFAAEMTAATAQRLSASGEVRWISPDAPVAQAACTDYIDTSRLLNTYVQAIGADRLWNSSPYLQGQGMTVAILDSGVNLPDDLNQTTSKSPTRVIAKTKTSIFTTGTGDGYGHGTHIAGIVGGNGTQSSGAYIGVAPKVNLVNVKVSDDVGSSTESDVVAGLQWVYDNRLAYNIRVVNLSLNSTVAQSYHTSPMNAALEILWFNGVVSVVSAGNNGQSSAGVLYPPANDPFVITVGAADDMGTANISDDHLASFSAYGTTLDGFAKPDLVAPGVNIVSILSGPSSTLNKDHPGYSLGGFGGSDSYFRMSGTSMASAVTSGAVALLLQDEPNLTPDQVKFRLKATANKVWVGFNPNTAGAGLLDAYAAVKGATAESANTDLVASQLLWSGSEPVIWGSVSWNSVSWNSVSWNSVSWNSVSWNSVSWNSDYWGP